MHDLDEVAILAASVATPALFAEIFERHYSAVNSYALRRVGSNVADDLASEVFVRAFKARGSFDAGRGTPRAWLYGIASNLLRQHWRGETRRLKATARLCFASTEHDGSADADARMDAQRLRGALADALASLAGRDRDVLLLHAWADLSHAEIAAALNIPDGTVRSRLARARAQLRERIPATGEEPDTGPTRRQDPDSGRATTSP